MMFYLKTEFPAWQGVALLILRRYLMLTEPNSSIL